MDIFNPFAAPDRGGRRPSPNYNQSRFSARQKVGAAVVAVLATGFFFRDRVEAGLANACDSVSWCSVGVDGSRPPKPIVSSAELVLTRSTQQVGTSGEATSVVTEQQRLTKLAQYMIEPAGTLKTARLDEAGNPIPGMFDISIQVRVESSSALRLGTAESTAAITPGDYVQLLVSPPPEIGQQDTAALRGACAADLEKIVKTAQSHAEFMAAAYEPKFSEDDALSAADIAAAVSAYDVNTGQRGPLPPLGAVITVHFVVPDEVQVVDPGVSTWTASQVVAATEFAAVRAHLIGQGEKPPQGILAPYELGCQQ